MPQFHLDTGGYVFRRDGFKDASSTWTNCGWSDLDTFTQAYVEALFFTSGDPSGSFNDGEAGENDDLTAVRGFSDLAPETLAAIIADCAKFRDSRAWADAMEGYEGADEQQAGHDFWLTRNGHGAGFWDGDWPEPHATTLNDTAKAFGEVDAYLGDNGKVYLS